MAGENINRRLNIYINDREVVNSMRGISGEMAKVRGQMRNLNKGTEDYDEQLKKLKDTYAQLKDKQEAFKEEIADTTEKMGEAREAFSKIFTGFSTGNAKMAQEGLNGIKGSILGVVKASWAFITTPIGATLAILAGIGAVTKMFVDYNEEIRASTRLIENLSGKTGQAAADIRVGVSALADTFKVEFNTIAGAVDNLVDTGVVKDEMEALEKIKNGLLKAPDSNEFLSSLESTSETARQLGLDLDDVIAIKEEIEAKGVDPEKVFGALEKATKNLETQSKSLRDELTSAFGAAFADEILKKVRTGEITINEALTSIGKKSQEVGLNVTEQQRLTSAVFGKAGIAAGGFAKILDIVTEAQSNQAQGLTDLQKNLDEVAKSQLAVEQAQDNALRSDGYESWKTKAVLAINTVKKGFWDFFYNITNGSGADQQQIKLNAQKKAIENYVSDSLKSFEEYIAMRKKSMGEDFDLEKVRQERLKSIRSTYSKIGDGSSWEVTPAQRAMQERLEAELEAVRTFGTEKKKLKDKQTEDEKTASDKSVEDAKKHSEDLQKQYEASQKELLATQRGFDDIQLGNQKESYEKEKALLDLEYSRKIEDLKINVKKEQEEIDKLQLELKNPKNNKSDVALLQNTIANKKEIQKEYNDTVIITQQAHDIKLASLQEKYLNLEFKREEEENTKALQSLKTQQNNELSSISTLEDAKAILKGKISDEELSRITTLEDAKKEITKQHLKEEYELQLDYLQKVSNQYKALLELDYSSGFNLLSDEERVRISNNLDELALKFSEFNLKIKEGDAPDPLGSQADGMKALSGIDILGFNPEQWNNVFNGLDDFQSKLDAVKTVVGGLQNAFGMYFDFVNAGENRTLKNFQSSTNRKKKELEDQLDKGYINQDIYNARVTKLDADLDKKKAEIEYKQAKRQKIMQAAQIISNTAQAIMGIWAQVPKFDFGVSAGVLTGVVGALGAAQLATVLAQPLPSSDGFYDGGFTGNGNGKDSPGPVHYNEYVVPAKVLFKDDPLVPQMIDYLEASRTGRNPSSNTSSNSSSTQMPQSSSNPMNNEVNGVMIEILSFLRMLKEKDFIAYVVNDIQTAKKIKEGQKKLEKITNQAKK